jgi:TRAP-type C4-dicarboxylate transport system substrate-binding protein
MMNQAKYDKLSPDEKKAVDAASGETAARIMGRNWDKVDRRAFALMQANNVQVTKADAKFVADVKAKTSTLEAKWVKEAEAKGLPNADKVLAEFRSEIAKASKYASMPAPRRLPVTGSRLLPCGPSLPDGRPN